MQYFEGDDSDEAEFSGKPGRKATPKAKKSSSSGDDAQDRGDDDSTPSTPAISLTARGYPRRNAHTTIKPQAAIESSDDSSDDATTPTKIKAERKAPSAPKIKKALLATSTESSFVQAHHPFCTRCGQRGEITKRKSKKKSDDEDDDEPLGSLLLCECCSAGFHRACLRKTYTDSLVGTGFRCDACIKQKGAECMECHEWVGKAGPPATPVSASTTPAAPISTDVESLAVSTPSSGVRDGQSPPADNVTIEEASDQPKDMDVDMPSTSEEAGTKEATEISIDTEATELTPSPDTPEVLFRCFRCTYTAHDKCLRPHPSLDKDADQALVIKQYRKDWKCHQCLEWDRELDQILAFRDLPITKANSEPSGEMEIDSTDAKTSEPTMVDSKDGTPSQAPNTVREFLIKWKGMSYRKVTWVPSYWVSQVVSPAKVKSFWKKTLGPAEAKDVILDEWTQVDVVMDVIFDQDFDGNEDDMDALDYIQSVFVKWKGLDYEHCKL